MMKMKDLCILLEDVPGALARLGEVLGRADVSIEGGGAAVVAGNGLGHFLVRDGEAARIALEAEGIRVLAVRDVVVQRLNQDEPGQLGRLTRKMADAGVNIEVLYSDHDHQLVLVVDNLEEASRVSREWEEDRQKREDMNASTKSLKTHSYQIQTLWSAGDGEARFSYRSYSRNHVVYAAGKPQIEASSDPEFRGDAARYNPEELLVASLSSCHMLWYLHLCANEGINILKYVDNAAGYMEENADGSGIFKKVTLSPEVTLSDGKDIELAELLHHEAHRFCFIANSVNFPVEIIPSGIPYNGTIL